MEDFSRTGLVQPIDGRVLRPLLMPTGLGHGEKQILVVKLLRQREVGCYND